MKYTMIAMACLALAACSPSTNTAAVKVANTVPGQLFCQFQAAGGGVVVASVIKAKAGDQPVAVLATDMGKAFVDSACAQAAANQGGTAGTPVSPPVNPDAVGQVAITVLSGAVAK